MFRAKCTGCCSIPSLPDTGPCDIFLFKSERRALSDLYHPLTGSFAAPQPLLPPGPDCPALPILQAELQADLESILKKSTRLIQACVDVVSSSSWLSPALAAMEMSQMVVQATWSTDSYLKQIPHMTGERLKRAAAKQVESVFDLTDLEDDERNDILRMSGPELADVARFCNRYPNVELNFEVEDEDNIHAGAPTVVTIELERDDDDGSQSGPVVAPYFPQRKDESWWLIVGEPSTNALVSIKKVNLQQKSTVKLEFPAGDEGKHEYKIYFMCDSFLGCDQEFDFTMDIKEKLDESSDEDSDEMSEDEEEA